MTGNILGCIARNSTTTDGIKISGHVFSAEYATVDEETDRIYLLDICIDCGKPSASFLSEGSTMKDKLLDTYKVIMKVGAE